MTQPSRARGVTTSIGVSLAILLGLACGGNRDDGSASVSADTEPAQPCEAGAAQCSCSDAFPCVDEGWACIGGTCEACEDGALGCPCGAQDVCDAGLACSVPDPTCTFQCPSSTCVESVLGTEDDTSGSSDGGSSDGGSSDGGAGCEPLDLCNRTIDDCAVEVTVDACLAFYDGDTCADVDAYTVCNCDCNAAPSCEEYFACGNLCFNAAC